MTWAHQRLHPGLRRPAAARRPGRRHPRPPPDVHRRARRCSPLGSFLGGLAPSFEFLLVGRVIQGVGGAIASPTALSLITTEFEEGPARTRAFAVYAAVSGAGAALGLLLGGVLTEYLDWRWVLFVNVPIGIGADGRRLPVPARVRAAAAAGSTSSARCCRSPAWSRWSTASSTSRTRRLGQHR